MTGLMQEYCQRKDLEVVQLEIDKDKPDHWHLMVHSKPNITPMSIATGIKQYASYNLWNDAKFSFLRVELNKIYWSRHEFFSQGTFISTIGNASADTLEAYIRRQG